MTAVRVDGSRVECAIEYDDSVREFFTDVPFFVEYDADVSGVPAGILTIPLLSQLCPAAWAAGADVYTPVVDRRFLDSLRDVGAVLCEMYPSFMEGGRVVAGETTDASNGETATGDGVGMLFTGGVDSLATYVRHRDEDPTLINVRGWLIGTEDDRWRHVRRQLEDYGRRFDADVQFVRSNMLEVLDTTMLSVHFSDEHDGGWYSAVGGGLGMLGLCAPLAAAEDFGTLYVAASHWEGFPVPEGYDHWDGRAMPWGSHPAVDEKVAWTGTDVVHDGFELTRQERVEVLASFAAAEQPDLPVRACESSPTGGNCNRCEKCLRTAFGLALAGRDPADHGFDVDREFLRYAREQFEAGAWLPDEHHQVYWREFQRRVDPDDDLPIEGADEFVQWLVGTDFSAIAGRPLDERALRAVARNVPYSVYAAAYPAYERAKDLLE